MMVRHGSGGDTDVPGHWRAVAAGSSVSLPNVSTGPPPQLHRHRYPPRTPPRPCVVEVQPAPLILPSSTSRGRGAHGPDRDPDSDADERPEHGHDRQARQVQHPARGPPHEDVDGVAPTP